eukprot:3555033-Rhodomonas_salina.1
MRVPLTPPRSTSLASFPLFLLSCCACCTSSLSRPLPLTSSPRHTRSCARACCVCAARVSALRCSSSRSAGSRGSARSTPRGVGREREEEGDEEKGGGAR